MSLAAEKKRIESLHARWHKAPRGSAQRRHLRRAFERAVNQAVDKYGKKGGGR